jgi:hypothetical protein
MKFKNRSIVILNKLFKIFILILLPFNFANAIDKIELSFFADQQKFNVQDRKKLVEFLKSHKSNDVYEFELLSLSDPLKMNLDDNRLRDIQAIFREYGININGLLSAKLKFIASDSQQLVISRTTKSI